MSFNEGDKYMMTNCETSETVLFFLNLLPYYFDYVGNIFHVGILVTSVGNIFNIKVDMKGSNRSDPAVNYMFQVNDRNSRARCAICSKLTIKTPRSGVFIVNFEHISHIFLVFLLLTLSM